jgi:hypothetical protein
MAEDKDVVEETVTEEPMVEQGEFDSTDLDEDELYDEANAQVDDTSEEDEE